MRIIILQPKYGGLGDHLFFSHIPRIVKENNFFDKVYISDFCTFRNNAYRKYIWEANPYVDGFVKEKGVDIDLSLEQFKDIESNLLDKIMLAHGIDDGKRFHEPEIYYKPKIIPELIGKTLYDPNYVSFVGDISFLKLFHYIEANNIVIDYQFILRDKCFPVIKFNNFLETKSFESFCDAIFTCRELFCLTSGTATLASALKKNATCFFGSGQSTDFHHSKLHKYIKI